MPLCTLGAFAFETTRARHAVLCCVQILRKRTHFMAREHILHTGAYFGEECTQRSFRAWFLTQELPPPPLTNTHLSNRVVSLANQAYKQR